LGPEADRVQEPRRDQARPPAGHVPERLDRPHLAAHEIAGHALHEHPSQATAAVVAVDVQRRQQHRVGGDRRSREPRRTRHESRWRIEHVTHCATAHHQHLAARAPLPQHVGDPGVLLTGGVVDPVAAYGVALPEHARAARRPHLGEVVERQAGQGASHTAMLRRGASPRPRLRG
jgi:hypothetical protein